MWCDVHDAILAAFRALSEELCEKQSHHHTHVNALHSAKLCPAMIGWDGGEQLHLPKKLGSSAPNCNNSFRNAAASWYNAKHARVIA